jgi:hypothetical protein
VKRQEEEREQRCDGQHGVVFHWKVSLLDFMGASLPCCLCLLRPALFAHTKHQERQRI